MKTTPFNVRLDDEQAEQVTALAKKFRLKEIDIIRWSIDALIAYVEKHNGHLHLPIDFDTLWEKIIASAPATARDEVTLSGEPKEKFQPTRKRA